MHMCIHTKVCGCVLSKKKWSAWSSYSQTSWSGSYALVLTLHVRDSAVSLVAMESYTLLLPYFLSALIYRVYVYLLESTSLKQLGELVVVLLAGVCGIELFIFLENFTPNRRG